MTLKAWSLGLLAALVVVAPRRSASADATVVVGSKNFTEQFVLAEMIAQVIEAHTDLRVERRFNLGGTTFAFEALRSGEIDVYPEYTGTVLVAILNEDATSDPSETWRRVNERCERDYGLSWTRPFGLNNTYALGVRSRRDDLDAIHTISDLSQHPHPLTLAATHEFVERSDGLSALVERYGLDFADVASLDPGLLYGAARDGQVDVIAAFATDARLRAFQIRLLDDDQGFFPPYEAAPLVRQDILQRYPELRPALERLSGQIDNDSMRELNYAVDFRGHATADVVSDFLASRRLVERTAPSTSVSSRDSFFPYVWSQRKEVARLLLEHLGLTLAALFGAIFVAVPVGILLTRKVGWGGPVFALANVFQTVPSLALLGVLMPLLGIGVRPALLALFLYALLPILRNTYTGIQEIDPAIKEACRGIGLTEAQILRKVEFPLALPVIMAGVRISAVLIVGTATLAALIGAGGLGDPIFRGISSVNNNQILLGAIPAALLAMGLDRGLHLLQNAMVSKGMRGAQRG